MENKQRKVAETYAAGEDDSRLKEAAKYFGIKGKGHKGSLCQVKDKKVMEEAGGFYALAKTLQEEICVEWVEGQRKRGGEQPEPVQPTALSILMNWFSQRSFFLPTRYSQIRSTTCEEIR